MRHLRQDNNSNNINNPDYRAFVVPTMGNGINCASVILEQGKKNLIIRNLQRTQIERFHPFSLKQKHLNLTKIKALSQEKKIS